ncbi:uncharacterized protein LOC127810192 [Diospyros lotus]|uniref:uncharacterized protein LOC127810192 n=1 Tax=Diospyros lotus TaxID=55363 RepID=UPI00224CE47A|nr:uncharacterized protein LOC127810192 [Diospyros lotus]
MATLQPSTLQISNPSLFSSSAPQPHAPPPRRLTFTPRATKDDSDSDSGSSSSAESDPDNFESRLSQVRLRYRSGTGKKAEIRKSRKGKKSSSSSSRGGMYLPPVALKEPVSGRMKVDFGFSPYSERVNGRIAILGLSALLLVELATGKSVINYHSPAIVFVQVYFVAAVSALYVKYEKESVSVWPPSQK